MKQKIKIGVIDYGMGNLHSVAKALALQGGNVVVSDSIVKLAGSDLLVLPGVGAFGAAMKTLGKKKLDSFVQKWVEEDKPYLGICLGFQLLFDKSEESKGVKGLGILKGDVVSFKKKDFKREPYVVPHMGWNSANQMKKNSEYFTGLNKDEYFYFVHTYFPVPKESSVIATETVYGKSFCSSVQKGNLFASQFHPEKSGTAGLKLLQNILKVATR